METRRRAKQASAASPSISSNQYAATFLPVSSQETCGVLPSVFSERKAAVPPPIKPKKPTNQPPPISSKLIAAASVSISSKRKAAVSTSVSSKRTSEASASVSSNQTADTPLVSPVAVKDEMAPLFPLILPKGLHCLTFDSETYGDWKDLVQKLSLKSHSQLAALLIQHYNKTSSLAALTECIQCRGPLSQCCRKCDIYISQSLSSAMEKSATSLEELHKDVIPASDDDAVMDFDPVEDDETSEAGSWQGGRSPKSSHAAERKPAPASRHGVESSSSINTTIEHNYMKTSDSTGQAQAKNSTAPSTRDTGNRSAAGIGQTSIRTGDGMSQTSTSTSVGASNSPATAGPSRELMVTETQGSKDLDDQITIITDEKTADAIRVQMSILPALLPRKVDRRETTGLPSRGDLKNKVKVMLAAGASCDSDRGQESDLAIKVSIAEVEGNLAAPILVKEELGEGGDGEFGEGEFGDEEFEWSDGGEWEGADDRDVEDDDSGELGGAGASEERGMETVPKNETAVNTRATRRKFTAQSLKPFVKVRTWTDFPRPYKKKKYSKYPCEQCGKQVYGMVGMERHLRTHDEEEQFPCQQCSARFVCQRDLDRHLSIHNEEPRYPCRDCDEKFFRSVDLAQHVKSVDHSQGKPHVCEKCGFVADSLSELKTHKQEHKERRNFACPVCGLNMRTQEGYNNHKLIHENARRFLCPHCPKRFNQPRTMQQHIERKHTENRTRSHMCEICGAARYSKDQLGKHMMIHTGVKPHKCGVCGAAFIQANALRGHMKIHTETAGKDNWCSLCGAAFKRISSIKVHMRKAHSDVTDFCIETLEIQVGEDLVSSQAQTDSATMEIV